MKRNRRHRGGRPRNVTAERTASGRAKRAPRSALGSLAAASPEAIAKRAALVGEANAHDARAGTAYGRLYLAGMLGSGDDATRRYSAAEQADRIMRTWASMAGVPVAATEGPRRHGELDPADWQRAKALAERVRSALGDAWRISLIEAICREGVEPPRLIGRSGGYIRLGGPECSDVTVRIVNGIISGLDDVACALGMRGKAAA